MPTSPLYNPDLAHIHIAGYDFHWKGAAPAVLHWLRQAKITSGTVVDLGCGGGQSRDARVCRVIALHSWPACRRLAAFVTWD